MERNKIVLKEVQIKPRVIPEHTYWLIRCLEYQYAKAFIERGSMKFANPSEWTKPDGTSRGDILEGAYASQRNVDHRMDGILKSLRNDVFVIRNRGFSFYKSQEILSYRAHCLYGLNSDNMHLQDVRSQDHKYHQVGKVPKDYFQKLFPTVKEEEIDSIDPKLRPAVLLIQPDAFISFVITEFKKRGVKEEEIFISPVSYIDYYKKPFIIGKEPEELFSKHISFSEQSEIRIVIDNRRKEIHELFDKDGIIELGPVDASIASLSEFYFKDMNVEIRGNELLYELAKPNVYDIDEVDDTSLIIIFQQALSDELPGAPMSIERIEEEMEKYFQILKLRDENALYNKDNSLLFYKGRVYNLSDVAINKMKAHYNTYILEKDLVSAGKTIAKFKHFFPSYDIGNYFDAYYRAIRD